MKQNSVWKLRQFFYMKALNQPVSGVQSERYGTDIFESRTGHLARQSSKSWQEFCVAVPRVPAQFHIFTFCCWLNLYVLAVFWSFSLVARVIGALFVEPSNAPSLVVKEVNEADAKASALPKKILLNKKTCKNSCKWIEKLARSLASESKNLQEVLQMNRKTCKNLGTSTHSLPGLPWKFSQIFCSSFTSVAHTCFE